MIFLLSRNIWYIFGQKNPMQCLYIVLSKINLWKNWSVHVFSWKLNFIYLIILAFPKLTIFSKARTSEDHSRNNCSKGASPRIWVHCRPTVHFIIWFVSLDYAQLNFLITLLLKNNWRFCTAAIFLENAKPQHWLSKLY